MKSPDIDQREALARIRFTSDGKVLLAYLSDCVEETVTRMIDDNDQSRVRMYQGECRALRVLSEVLNPVSPERPGME